MPEEKTQKSNSDIPVLTSTSLPPNEDFDVIFASKTNDKTIVVTSMEDIKNEKLSMALSTYDPENKKYSVYLNEGISPSNALSADEINELAVNTQNDISKVQKINAYNRKLINKNDIVGKTVESIDTNINTEVRLAYSHINPGRNKAKKLTECKIFIQEFNESIKLSKLTRNSVTTTYIEGNFISYLRHEDINNYVVDVYPLGVCEISDYDINGDPVVLFDITALRTRLNKTYKKNKKNKALFFDKIEDEVKANYPKEVYDAFVSKEKYAVLDPKYTGVIRIGNINRKYGISPIFRAYTDLNMLETFADSDRINSRAKSKKIIHQKMRKETMGQDFNKDFFPEMAYAHQNLMDAWKQPTVIVTSPPTVEDIEYIEPKVDMTSKDTYNTYRAKVLSTLGIQFLMDSGSQSVSTASISVTQLMRTINSITEQLEDVLNKWYKQILIDNNYPVEYAPIIKIIDSEMLEMDIKKELATTLYTTFNTSLKTSLELLGIDVNDEMQRRKEENDSNFDADIFYPRASIYTMSGNDVGGRPADSDNTSKQQYDKTRQETL